jgi:hypothetical protein
MHTSRYRQISEILAFLLFVLGACVNSALAEEKPDAPIPKREAMTSGQGPANPSASRPVRDGTTWERLAGFKRGFKSFETPDDAPPLTPRQKYVYALYQMEDLKAHIGNVLQAAVQQGFDASPHYGQGWGPYAQRFGAAEADQVTSTFFIYGFFPHILKTDPRYFRKKHGSVWSRVNYAVSRTLITRTDSGESTFNTPQVVGQLFQTGISTAYYPEQDRTAGRVFKNWGLSLMFNSGYNVVSEFYPDAIRHVFHRK